MSNNPQVQENFKIKFSDIFLTFRSFFETSEEIAEDELEKKIRAIEKQQDNDYIANLEKAVTTYGIESKKSKAKTEKMNVKIMAKNAKEYSKVNDVRELEEEKER